MPKITIIGAGLAGPLLGICLRRQGYEVCIYEKYPDIRSIPSLGRSINLVLTSRGLRAVKAADPTGQLLREMTSISVPTMGRVIHHTDGSVDYQRYGKDDSEFNHSISRYELNKFVIDKAEQQGVEFHFNHTLENLTVEGKWPVLEFTIGSSNVKKFVACKGPVIGSDGAGSLVRTSLQKLGHVDFTAGYKEIIFPKGTGLANYGLHIWPRGSHFLMALANQDDSFTGTIYIDNEGHSESFKELNSPEKIMHFFNKHYKDTVQMLGGPENIVRQMMDNPVGLLGTVKTNKYNLGGKVLLLGDSAHAITPFFGQGTNASFEDVFVLSNYFQMFAPASEMSLPSLAAVFAAYNSERKPNSDAIADMALENFIEMRSKVGDKKFLLMKNVQNILENTFPKHFRSRYAMVCYGGDGNLTYFNAKNVGDVQWSILEELCSDINSPEEVDMKKAKELIVKTLIPINKLLNLDFEKIVHSKL